MKVRFAVSVGMGPPDPAHLTEVAVEAERQGFDTLWLSDVPSLPGTDPLVGAAYIAAVTRRVHVGVNLIPFGATPYVVAHRLAQLDQVTQGRLLVTLVPGLDLPGERAALGTAGRHRGRMMDEVVPELRRLWAGGAGELGSGTVGLPVRPVQDPLEVWLGGSGPEAIARAGRLADGWLGSLVSPRRAGQIRAGIEAEATSAGRTIDPEHFGLSIGYARDRAALESAVRRPVAVRPRRPDLDPGVDAADLVPVGEEALRRLVEGLVGEGLSKFVVRPVAPPASWATELAWLAGTLLDLQT